MALGQVVEEELVVDQQQHIDMVLLVVVEPCLFVIQRVDRVIINLMI
jgi:hypothetical protein